jgi:hypothetical protein
MTNKPKQIGTAGETGVKNALIRLGYPLADRRAQQGAEDAGDVMANNDVMVEVKAGTAAKTASLGQIHDWLSETETERQNRRCKFAFLVTARPGFSPKRAEEWWAWMWLEDFDTLICDSRQSASRPYCNGHQLPDEGVRAEPVRITLRTMAKLLAFTNRDITGADIRDLAKRSQ